MVKLLGFALDIISIAEGRKDIVAFLSPELADVVNNEGNEGDDVVDFRNTLGSTSCESLTQVTNISTISTTMFIDMYL